MSNAGDHHHHQKQIMQRQQAAVLSFKHLSGQLHLHSFINYLLLFLSLLVCGITLSFYLKDISLHLQLHQFSLQSSLPSKPTSPIIFNAIPSPPPPTPSTLPPPSPTISPPQDVAKATLDEFLRPPKVLHNMRDEELLWRASLVPRIRRYPYKRVPKVAFMFLVKGSLPLAPFWELFFKGHQGFYSIYVHSSSSHNATASPDSVFYGQNIPSKEVKWGKVSMIEAERRLLANALLDFSNQRFVLLSEACIPLFNFSTIYSYLINSKRSFVEVYDLDGPVGRGRYNSRMRPAIHIDQWRKGSQWFEMDRDLAVEVVSDRRYFPVFQRFCRGQCYSDEHYLPTLMNIRFGRRNSNRTLMWVDWTKGGPHPNEFGREHVTVEFLEKLRAWAHCDYNNEETNICYLFARKFLPPALGRLLRFGPKVMQF